MIKALPPVAWANVLKAALVLYASVPAARAQAPPSCFEVCGTSCVKPILIPDRWDDVTAIAGYDGSSPKRANWRNNLEYDQEQFTDSNGNGRYDAGEPYLDGNANGKFDQEAYDPRATGYVVDPGNAFAPSGDLGLEITLQLGSVSSPVPGQYQAFDLPPLNKGTPVAGSSAYDGSWTGCNPSTVEPGDRLQVEAGSMSGPTNQAMRNLVAQDPDAYWDPITESVQGSAFAISPRILLVPACDPRGVVSATSALVVTKIIPMFIEQMTGNAIAQVRMLQADVAGTTCAGGSSGDWLRECATPAARASWGRVKATYR